MTWSGGAAPARVANGLRSGFTLLEVIITVALLTSLVLAISSLMRRSFDMQLSLSERAQVSSRLNVAMELVRQDLEQAYMLSVNEDKVRLVDGSTPTYFHVDTFGGRTTVKFTTLHGTDDAPQGAAAELIEVSYSVETSRQYATRKALFRAQRILGVDTDLVLEPVVEGIAALELEMWNGERWLRAWDTDKSEFKQSIPHLLRVRVQAYPEDPMVTGEDAGSDEFASRVGGEFTSELLDERRSLIYLSWARRFTELKTKTTTLKF